MKDAKILIVVLAFIAGAAVSTLCWRGAERKRAAEPPARENPPAWYLETRFGNVLDKSDWRSYVRARGGRKILYGEFESRAEAERNIEPLCDALLAKVFSVPDIPVPSGWLCRPFVKPVAVRREKRP